MESIVLPSEAYLTLREQRFLCYHNKHNTTFKKHFVEVLDNAGWSMVIHWFFCYLLSCISQGFKSNRSELRSPSCSIRFIILPRWCQSEGTSLQRHFDAHNAVRFLWNNCIMLTPYRLHTLTSTAASHSPLLLTHMKSKGCVLTRHNFFMVAYDSLHSRW